MLEALVRVLYHAQQAGKRPQEEKNRSGALPHHELEALAAELPAIQECRATLDKAPK